MDKTNQQLDEMVKRAFGPSAGVDGELHIVVNGRAIGTVNRTEHAVGNYCGVSA
jgi:hypothetical protein